MHSSSLAKMEAKVDVLPLLPQVLVRIMQLNPEQDDYFDEISRLAHEDPPFAVRLIALANSASSSPMSPVRSIKGALSRVGSTTIASLVATLSVQRVFMPASAQQTLLWSHSVGVAVVMELLAQLHPELKLERGEAYLMGLLHDIGRFVMFEHAPESLLKVDAAHWTNPQELIEADVEIFEYTHSELGFLACTRWGIPQEIGHAVRDHHKPPLDDCVPGSCATYTKCLEIADKYELLVFSGPGGDALDTADLADMIEESVLFESCGGRLINAKRLAEKTPLIRARREELLNGLGLRS